MNFSEKISEALYGLGFCNDSRRKDRRRRYCWVSISALPNSGFIFKFSFTMGLTEDGSYNEEFKTKPDIEITQKWYSNIFADKSIEYILTDKIQDAKASDILKVALICILIVGVIIYKIWFKIL